MQDPKTPTEFSDYLFILAHPDDEVYTCVFISELTKSGKNVHVVYVTSGDYAGAELGPVREKEVHESMSLVGVPKEHVHFLHIPERELMGRVSELSNTLLSLASKLQSNCIVSHDFEGGHNGHDAVSFCASQVTQSIGTSLFVFPAYHGWPENRVFNQFVSGREASYTLPLSPSQKQLQEKVVGTHKTQAVFFGGFKKNGGELFFEREVLRHVREPINYALPPDHPIGYEYPGSRITFEDFKRSIGVEKFI